MTRQVSWLEQVLVLIFLHSTAHHSPTWKENECTLRVLFTHPRTVLSYTLNNLFGLSYIQKREVSNLVADKTSPSFKFSSKYLYYIFLILKGLLGNGFINLDIRNVCIEIWSIQNFISTTLQPLEIQSYMVPIWKVQYVLKFKLNVKCTAK